VAVKRLQGYKVFHLHWHAFHLDKKYNVPFTPHISLLNTIVSLTALKILGYKLIWTVHNVLPHEPQTANDKFVTRYTAKLASHIIVHSSETLKQLKAIGADTSKAVVNPHGNYAGMYPVTVSRDEARRRLGIAPQDRALLFFGNIRPYKGVEQLLEAFEQLHEKNVRLVIAGKCLDTQLANTIRDAAQKDPDITFHNGNVPDEDVATYFQAADAACMPFTNVTTSGSVLLAATFGKPIVTPYMGAIKDMPKAVGVLYDPGTKDALLNALRIILADDTKLAGMAKASAAFSKTLDWDKISAKTYELYR
ncbi:MAG: glycosyltransferase family 4 protein, partial [Patescibacteria group bacterium]